MKKGGCARTQWDSALETGIPVVDEQHRALFRHVEESLFDCSKRMRVGEMLDFLGDYVLKHFGTEEMMQKISHYPAASAHRELHEAFATVLENLKAEFQDGGCGMIIRMKVTKAVLDWLEFHIKGADREFAEYFKRSGYAAG